MEMQLARKSKLLLLYNNKNISEEIDKYLLNFTYADHANGKADDLQIVLEDRAGLWRSDWFPEKGARLSSGLVVVNWNGNQGEEALPLGFFEIDELEPTGPPDIVTLKAISVPISSSLWGEDKTRAWEKTKLSAIANDIAGTAGLGVFYDTAEDPPYDRIEQTEQPDLPFLQKLCEDAGLSLKVTGDKLVIFDDSKYEQLEPVKTIIRGKSNVLSYSGRSQTRNIYSACRVEYKGGKKKEDICFTYTPPNRPKTGKTLVINERVDSIAEAERLAKKRLRQKNCEEMTFNLTLQGDITLVAGVTVMIEGWGVFDGKYFINQATHGGPGYAISLELRRVLEGY